MHGDLCFACRLFGPEIEETIDHLRQDMDADSDPDSDKHSRRDWLREANNSLNRYALFPKLVIQLCGQVEIRFRVWAQGFDLYGPVGYIQISGQVVPSNY